MKAQYLIALLLIPLVSWSQKSFTIKGDIKSLKTGDKIYLIYGANLIDSATVTNGNFNFSGMAVKPEQGKLFKNVHPNRLANEAGSVADFATLYVEAGNVILTSESSLKNAIIKGTATNDELLSLLNAEKPVRDKLLEQSKKRALLDAEKDIDLISQSKKEIAQLLAAYDPIRYEFIRKHSASLVSLNLLEGLSKDQKRIKQVELLFNALDEKLKKDERAIPIIEAIDAYTNTMIGSIAPNFVQPDAQGKLIKLTDFRGKFVLIDFWASWCNPCRQENPNIVALYQKYKDKGLAIIGISLDDLTYKEAWLKAIKDDGLIWTQVCDFKEMDNDAVKRYGINAIPSTFLIDPDGRIVAKNLRGEALHEKLAQLLKNR